MAAGTGSRLYVTRVVVGLALVAFYAVGWPSTASADSSQGTITGRVTDGAGQPVGPDSGMCALLGNSTSGWSNLEADGTYRIENVEPGDYAVRFVFCSQWLHPAVIYAGEFYPNIHDPAVAQTAALPNIHVAAGQTVSGIDAQLEVGGQLTVKLVDGASMPRAGLCVTAKPALFYTGAGRVGSISTDAGGVTGVDGRVTLPGLSPDNYLFIARACDSTLTDPDLTRFQYSGGGFVESAATSIRVDLAQSVSTQMTMAAGATISGQVTLDGAPVVGGCVEWFSDRQSSSDRVTTTDAQGRYSMTGLTPISGALRASASYAEQEDGVAATWAPFAASRSTASDIALTPGGQRTQNVVLHHGATLSIIVTSLPNPSGCEVVVTDSQWQLHRLALRSTTRGGVYMADVFDLPGQSLGATLECGGRRVGVWRRADWNTPFYVSTTMEDVTSPVAQIIYDAAGPVITPSPDPATMNWSKVPVTVSFRCTDAGVGVFSCPGPVRMAAGESTTVSAMDADGNVSTLWVMPHVDSTPPAINVTGSGRTFKGDEPMQFACDVSDDRSGVAWVADPCPAWGTPASTLGAGTHTFHLKASDWAGNISETTATVIVK